VDLFIGEAAPLADFQAANAHGANGHAHQLGHFAFDRFHHAAHLPVAAFSDDDFEKRVFGGIADSGDQGGARGAVVERRAAAQALELFVAEQSGCLHEVSLG